MHPKHFFTAGVALTVLWAACGEGDDEQDDAQGTELCKRGEACAADTACPGGLCQVPQSDPYLGEDVGDAMSPDPEATAATSSGAPAGVTRDRVIQLAAAQADHVWHCSSANLKVTCSSSWSSDYSAGDFTGIPYDWGGYDDIARFDDKIAQGYGAGSHSKHGVLSCTTGLDCSGYVSRCWETSGKYGTATLREIASNITKAQMLPGDVYNKSGSHVVIHAYFRDDGVPAWYEAAGTPHKVRFYATGSWSYLNGYQPMRYNKIIEGGGGTGGGSSGGGTGGGSALLGSKDNPIKIDKWPYVDTRNTSNGASDIFNEYSCQTGTYEKGPEFIYAFEASGPGSFSATVNDGSGVDIDIHTLTSLSANACTARGDTSLTWRVPAAGTYYLVADTWSSASSGKEYPGQYTLNADFKPDTPPPPTCTPACAGKQCGDDGCGGSCGTCGAGATCNFSNALCEPDGTVCTPACAGKQCGDDGCGGSCGTCGGGKSCASGQCVAQCTPNCSGRVCGSDGCGGTCGTCATGKQCNASGLCEAPRPLGGKDNPIPMDRWPYSDSRNTTSAPSDIFNSYSCAPNTGERGGEFFYYFDATGSGTFTASVSDGSSVDIDLQVLTALDANSCTTRNDTAVSYHVPAAGRYYLTADTYSNSSGKEYPGSYSLSANFKLDPVCTPSCGGKICGDDGCGGSCGSCGAGEQCTAGACVATGDRGSLPKGDSLGKMYNTYYYFALESDYSGADDTTLYNASCQAIATVPAKFSDSVCIEGSGRLSDGTVINYAKTCSCGRTCPTGGKICYDVLDPQKFPWGLGSKGNALEPLRSWATDQSFVPYGTVVYIEEWDGVQIPAIDGIGGYTHDGCFRADDIGGAIKGNHFDFFAGTHDMWQALEKIYPTKTNFTVYKNSPRCSHIK